MIINLNEKDYEIKYVCRMSDEPLKFGFGIKITEEIWGELKEKKDFKVGEIYCKITDEIDVGDRTWFIFVPEDEVKFVKKFKGTILNI